MLESVAGCGFGVVRYLHRSLGADNALGAALLSVLPQSRVGIAPSLLAVL